MQTRGTRLAATAFVVLTLFTSSARALEFEEGAEDAWLNHTTVTWGSFWTDYDGDGDVDPFLGRHRLNGLLFEHRGDHYVRSDVPELRSFFDRHGCAWGEANGDGDADLFCTQGADEGQGRGPNQLLVQTRDGGFDDRAHAYGVTDELGRGRTANWLDYDGDGDLDLFVGNRSRSDAPNVLFRNDKGAFARTDAGVDDSVGTRSSSWSDWDRDGDPDLLILSTQGVLAYTNDGGTFTRSAVSGIPLKDWEAATWGDYDGDGWTDLHLLAPRTSLILRNEAGKLAPASSERVRHARSSVWFDAQDDGDLDLFVVQGGGADASQTNRPDFVLRNAGGVFERIARPAFAGPTTGSGDSVAVLDHDRDADADLFVTNGRWDHAGTNWLLVNSSSDGNSVAIDLEGTRWNPHAFGARLRVVADPLDYRREITDATGARAQSEVGYTTLGIGDADLARVRIRWPDGRRDCVTVAAGESVRVRIGTTTC